LAGYTAILIKCIDTLAVVAYFFPVEQKRQRI